LCRNPQTNPIRCELVTPRGSAKPRNTENLAAHCQKIARAADFSEVNEEVIAKRAAIRPKPRLSLSTAQFVNTKPYSSADPPRTICLQKIRRREVQVYDKTRWFLALQDLINGLDID
jgi:hypothetical protein